ncbi:4-hydroxy-3-polyprenylbenzoate decarboxylase [Thermosyntropha lipolytica DSM 11003]|uniref:Flavin prenyltransferase UbiX n=1 Tax=Thermosyntropha lipolytica DSM 11003 TaxID=1123382 RepID=A0A1M5NJV0_9FIRM|nr:flavin prenyltransferase UbiX [Thermosyntropha lipolytica]SHG89856.1 4-hydroxy-3-polyprenylbenzoate decarboxylase [Thermosyntropha lipolytica DSM 11003]
MKRYVVAFTGASGVIYGVRLVEELLERDYEVHLIVSDPAKIVLTQEMGWDFTEPEEEVFKKHFKGNLRVYDNADIAAPVASGSFLIDGMIVIPCTMSTISSIAHGTSKNLLERAADVILKERRQLIIVPRETPLSTVHLRNMLILSEMGVHVIPAMPAFYHFPKTIDDMVNFVVGKVLDAMRIPNELYNRYN